MPRDIGATLSGPDQRELMSALLATQDYTETTPSRLVKLSEKPVTSDWRERLLALEEIAVEWGPWQRIGVGRGTIAVSFEPGVAPAPAALLDLFARLPLELAVMTSIPGYWIENDYYSPGIDAEHALLGSAMAFKGASHEHSLMARRWLEHGPLRTLRGPNDTTLVLFHDFAADGPTSLAQAMPGHEWIVAGFLRPKHRYTHDIAGIYTQEDGLLRIVVTDRPVTDAELLDACAARRDGRADPAKPIKNIAYVFLSEKQARVHLEALWLRGLECRVADGAGERRLDADYQPTITKPSWVGAA